MLIIIFEHFSCQLHNTVISVLFRLCKKPRVHIFVLIHFFFCTFLHHNLRINFSELGLIELAQDLAQSRQNNKYSRLQYRWVMAEINGKYWSDRVLKHWKNPSVIYWHLLCYQPKMTTKLWKRYSFKTDKNDYKKLRTEKEIQRENTQHMNKEVKGSKRTI